MLKANLYRNFETELGLLGDIANIIELQIAERKGRVADEAFSQAECGEIKGWGKSLIKMHSKALQCFETLKHSHADQADIKNQSAPQPTSAESVTGFSAVTFADYTSLSVCVADLSAIVE